MNFKDILLNKILVLDGAMGTMIQEYGLKESDFRGVKFKDWNINLKGCNDILVLTNPDKISEIHHKYLEAGADIIETNTFNSTSVSLDDYALSEFVEDINFNAAILAKKEAELFTKRNPEKPRFVAGSIGPTNKTTSLSPDVDNPAFRSITFDQLKLSYKDQIKALIKGGVDLLLIETIFDTLNAKAAINASIEAMSELEKEVPIMLSVTLSDKGGRTLSGQTLHAFLASVMHAPILSVGLNCSFGADEMKSFVKQLGDISPYFISAYPNAGLPNRFGEYDETPEIMGEKIGEFLNESLVNIIGGCCGTTPEHIRIISEKASKATPHIPSVKNNGAVLSGLEILEIKSENNVINIGEGCNDAGSRKFLRLINEGKYDEAL